MHTDTLMLNISIGSNICQHRAILQAFSKRFFWPLIMYMDKFLTKKVKSWIMKGKALKR